MTESTPITLDALQAMKRAGQKITCLTTYDASFTTLLENNGVDILLVGDSLGMVVQGHDSTLPVTMSVFEILDAFFQF